MEGTRRLNSSNESYESWIWLFGRSLDQLDEQIATTGIEKQRPRLMYLVAMCRRLLDSGDYRKFMQAAREAPWPDLYDLIASLTLRADKEWTWNEDEPEKIPFPVVMDGTVTS